MCWNVQKVSGPAWLRKGPRVGQCLWVCINHQVTFLTHPPPQHFILGTWPRLACGQLSSVSER